MADSSVRPTMLAGDAGDVHREVARVRELADLYKVYRREWLVCYTSRALGADGEAEAREVFETRYAGRVKPEDVRYSSARLLPTTSIERVPVYLELRLPTVRGEHKHRASADAQAAELGGEVEVVVRNSREEHTLVAYGVKKLAAVGG